MCRRSRFAILAGDTLVLSQKVVYVYESTEELSNRKQPKELEVNKYKLEGSSSPSRIVVLHFLQNTSVN